MTITLVRESPEHHFLTMLESLKGAPEGWTVVHCRLSGKLVHADLIDDPALIRDKLSAHRQESESLVSAILDDDASLTDATLYPCAIGDLVLLARDAEGSAMERFHRALSGKIGKKQCSRIGIAEGFYDLHRLADELLIEARRMDAYEAMSDSARVSSLPVRRERRRETLVLMVEDDRFTATFAANILSKDCELVHSRTGEEAIVNYIEHAPDAVFLDIHLPGINGLDALAALRKIDPQSYIVMMSGDAVKTNIVASSAQGAAGFMKKPFTRERILAMVEKSPFYKPIRPGRPSRM